MPRPRQHRALRSLDILPSSPRNASPPPASPTFSDTTNVSAMNFGQNTPEKIITRAHLKSSLQAYDDLLTTSATYRTALLTMSKVTADFATAIATCSGLKGPSYEAGTRLHAASGFHHLIGNHWHVLAETLDRKFERPLRQHLDTYRAIVKERSTTYEKALHEKSSIIRKTEMRNMNRKERNLQSFREALAILQRQVDDLDDLKARHYQEIMEHEEEVWNVVQGKVCLMVRSTMDVFEKFTAKASDPVLEPMLQSIPDPFDAYGPPKAEDSIFSILPPLSVISGVPSSSPSPMSNTPDSESLGAASARNTWTPTNGFSNSITEWVDTSPPSTPSSSISPPSLNLRTAHPSSTTFQSRKSESRLRNVLHTIDESQARNENLYDSSISDPQSTPPRLSDDGISDSNQRLSTDYLPSDITPHHSPLDPPSSERELPGTQTPRNSMEEPPDSDRRTATNDETPKVLTLA